MRYQKDFIISEIIRTAKQNGDKALGTINFLAETGIKESDWRGRYWAKWGDALLEAGYEPNRFGEEAYEDDFLLTKMIELIKESKKFPTVAEISMKKRQDKTFPSAKSIRRFGSQKELARKIADYCQEKADLQEAKEICLPLCESKESNSQEIRDDVVEVFSFVYLMKSGKFYKIGRSSDAEMRRYQIGIQLPEKIEIIHKIKTDDSVGIEEYWHKRFKEKRKNGEWFELSATDVKIFKRRTFM